MLISVQSVRHGAVMTRKVLSPFQGYGLIGFGAMLWAAGPALAAAPSDTAGTMPIQVTGSSLGSETTLPEPAVKPKLSASGVFQPAPMPDPDADPPSAGAAAQRPSITPALFSHKEEFAGDGFAAASDADHGLDHRRAPAAGLNWSVPVK